MRKFVSVFVIVVTCFCFVMGVDAASFNVSSSVKSVAPNGSFTVSIGGDAIGRVDLSVTNGSISTTSVWVEQNTQTITVIAGMSGQVTVTATPVIGFSDADANLYNPGARTVTVNVITPSTPVTPPVNSTGTPPSSTTTNNGQKKSTNNALLSLEVEGGMLSPDFDSKVNEYNVNLSSDTASVKISAKAEDSKAKVSGTGEIKVVPGMNTIKISVTAENGNIRTYVVKIYVDEKPNVYLPFDGKDIGLIRNLDDVELEGFKKDEENIDGKTISVFKNDVYTLIYGIDEEEKKNFYILKDGCIENVFIPVLVGEKTYYITSSKSKDEALATTIIIGDVEVAAEKTQDEDFYVVRVLDDEGKATEYLYDTKEATLQRRTMFCYKEKNVSKIGGFGIKVLIIVESVYIMLSTSVTVYLYRRKGKSHE